MALDMVMAYENEHCYICGNQSPDNQLADYGLSVCSIP